MRVLAPIETQQVHAAGVIPYLNEEKELVISVAYAFGALGGMLGGTFYGWKGLLAGTAIGLVGWPLISEAAQGFPHFRQWFGKEEKQESVD